MRGLHRHGLVRLHAAAWAELLARRWDGQALACLQHWAAHDLPLVVATQRRAGGAALAGVSLGVAAPLCWGRRRLGLQLPLPAIALAAQFPAPAAVAALLPAAARPAWRRLADALRQRGLRAHVYGSHGWQQLTGLAYLRPASDLDLWLAVDGAAEADAACALLQSFDALRLDGELVFGNGDAVHWREWQDWRAGRVRSLMVRRLDDAVLVLDYAPAAGRLGEVA